MSDKKQEKDGAANAPNAFLFTPLFILFWKEKSF